MKGTLEEILNKLKPDTTIEEFLSFCDNMDDVNCILEEYGKLHDKDKDINTDKD